MIFLIISVIFIASCSKKEDDFENDSKHEIETDSLWFNFTYDYGNDSVIQLQSVHVNNVVNFENLIWVSTSNGISSISKNGVSNYSGFSPYYIRVIENKLVANQRLYDSESLFYSFNNGEWKPNYILNQTIKPFTIKSNSRFNVIDFIEYDQKVFFAFGYNGFVIMNQDGSSEFKEIPSQSVNSFKIDSKGRVWFQGEWGYFGSQRDTLCSTISYYDEGTIKAITLPTPIKSNDISAVEDIDGITISSFYWRKIYRLKDNDWIDITNDFPSNQISDFVFDRKGNLWISSYDNGVAKLSKNSWKVYNLDNYLPTNYIHTLYFDSLNFLWISTDNNGLVKYKNPE